MLRHDFNLWKKNNDYVASHRSGTEIILVLHCCSSTWQYSARFHQEAQTFLNHMLRPWKSAIEPSCCWPANRSRRPANGTSPVTLIAAGYDYASVIMMPICHSGWMKSYCIIGDSGAPTVCGGWLWWGGSMIGGASLLLARALINAPRVSSRDAARNFSGRQLALCGRSGRWPTLRVG